MCVPTFLVLMHILTFLFFSLNLSSDFLDPFFPLVKMLSEPENTKKRITGFISYCYQNKKKQSSLAWKNGQKHFYFTFNESLQLVISISLVCHQYFFPRDSMLIFNAQVLLFYIEIQCIIQYSNCRKRHKQEPFENILINVHIFVVTALLASFL